MVSAALICLLASPGLPASWDLQAPQQLQPISLLGSSILVAHTNISTTAVSNVLPKSSDFAIINHAVSKGAQFPDLEISLKQDVDLDVAILMHAMAPSWRLVCTDNSTTSCRASRLEPPRQLNGQAWDNKAVRECVIKTATCQLLTGFQQLVANQTSDGWFNVGQLLHILQDSYGPGHVVRGPATATATGPRGLQGREAELVCKKLQVVAFQSTELQDPNSHLNADMQMEDNTDNSTLLRACQLWSSESAVEMLHDALDDARSAKGDTEQMQRTMKRLQLQFNNFMRMSVLPLGAGAGDRTTGGSTTTMTKHAATMAEQLLQGPEYLASQTGGHVHASARVSERLANFCASPLEDVQHLSQSCGPAFSATTSAAGYMTSQGASILSDSQLPSLHNLTKEKAATPQNVSVAPTNVSVLMLRNATQSRPTALEGQAMEVTSESSNTSNSTQAKLKGNSPTAQVLNGRRFTSAHSSSSGGNAAESDQVFGFGEPGDASALDTIKRDAIVHKDHSLPREDGMMFLPYLM